MLSHMQHHAVDIFEESYVTQLVQLVMTDGLDGHLLLISAIFALEVPIAATPEPGKLTLDVEQNL